jgi:hypothetical protein
VFRVGVIVTVLREKCKKYHIPLNNKYTVYCMTSMRLAFTNGTRTPLVFCLFARRINYPLARRRVVTGLGPFPASLLFSTAKHPWPGAGLSRDWVPSRLVLYFPPQATPSQLWGCHGTHSGPVFSAINNSSSGAGLSWFDHVYSCFA